MHSNSWLCFSSSWSFILVCVAYLYSSLLLLHLPNLPTYNYTHSRRQPTSHTWKHRRRRRRRRRAHTQHSSHSLQEEEEKEGRKEGPVSSFFSWSSAAAEATSCRAEAVCCAVSETSGWRGDPWTSEDDDDNSSSSSKEKRMRRGRIQRWVTIQPGGEGAERKQGLLTSFQGGGGGGGERHNGIPGHLKEEEEGKKGWEKSQKVKKIDVLSF